MRPWHAYHACVHKPMGRIPPRQPPSPCPAAGPLDALLYASGPGVLERCTICVLIVI